MHNSDRVRSRLQRPLHYDYTPERTGRYHPMRTIAQHARLRAQNLGGAEPYLTLPNMRAYIPAFDSDLRCMIQELMTVKHPAYLRLGYSEQPSWLVPGPYAAWRRILPGDGPTVAFEGPLAGAALDAIRESGLNADSWLVSELPIHRPPPEFLSSVRRSGYLLVVEEHVSGGGFGQMLACELLAAGVCPTRFVLRPALGYVSGLYGSQRFHRKECGLDPESIVSELNHAAHS